MRKTKIVVGISLGTRQLGIACFRSHRLSDWRMHSFRYAWSSFKKKQILRYIAAIIKQQGATLMALKITEPEKQTAQYKELLMELEALLFQHHIPCYLYTLEQLKTLVPMEYQKNKVCFMEGVLKLYPELQHEYEKECTNTTSYYSKVFEAIAAGRLCDTTK